MKRILIAASLFAIAACIVSSFITPMAKANAKILTYLPMIMRTGAITQPSTPTSIPIQPTLTPVQPTQVPGDLAQKRAEVIAAVNVERQKAGCALVIENTDLSLAAQAWSDYMVAHHVIAHSTSVAADWYGTHAYTETDWVSENIAGGQSTGAEAVAAWMSDEGHRAVVLQSCTNTTGIFHIGVGFNNQAWTLVIGELHD